MYTKETHALFNQFNSLASKSKITLADLNTSLAVAIPRIDFYISYKSIANSESYLNIIEREFGGGLKKVLVEYNDLGRLNKQGETTDLAAYVFRFDKLGIDYHWIPKNACTFFKKVLAEKQDPNIMDEVVAGQFHESMNKIYSLTMADVLATRKENKKVCIIRDPVERFVSCYVDKFLKPICTNTPLEPFVFNILTTFYRKVNIKADPNVRSISFSEFVSLVINTPVYATNEHWRPQSSFLKGVAFDKVLMQDSALDWFISHGYALEKYKNKRSNSSVGKTYTHGTCHGELAGLLPSDITLDDVVDYSIFVDNTSYLLLSNYYKEDYSLINDQGVNNAL